MDILGRIDELCSQRGITKYRLSQMTGISQSAFSKMKREQNTLSVETINRICEALGISVAQFFSESGNYPDLTGEQKQILDRWEKLDPEKRQFAFLMLEQLGGL